MRATLRNAYQATHSIKVILAAGDYMSDQNTFKHRVTLDALAQLVSNGLDYADSSLAKTDPMKKWPSEPDALLPIFAAHLEKADWYGELSDEGKQLWQVAFEELCTERFGFNVESDGVYWNVVSEAVLHHGAKVDTITDLEVTHFGNRPFRYFGTVRSFDQRCPYHSMHTPDEVREMIEQFQAAEDRIRKSRWDEAGDDFDELMPVLDTVVKKNRVLYVGVDT